MNTVFIVGIIQGLFILGLMLLKKRKSWMENILICWLLLIVLHLSYSALSRNGLVNSSVLSLANGLVPFMQGPMLYLYFTSVYVSRIDRYKAAIHFLPIVLLLIYQLVGVGYAWINSGFYIYLMLSVPVYILWVLRCIFLISRNDSDKRDRVVAWLKWPLIGLGLIWTTFLVFEFLIRQDIVDFGPYFFIAVSAFVYLLGIHLYRNSVLINVSQPAALAPPSTLEKAVKYSKSGLSEEKAEGIHQALLTFMKQEKPYLNAELGLDMLSKALGHRANHLSQIINEREGKSFTEFVNAYRVQAFIAQYQSGIEAGQSILAAAYDCGFKSKSSFNRIFKKETGQSPSDYFRQP